ERGREDIFLDGKRIDLLEARRAEYTVLAITRPHRSILIASATAALIALVPSMAHALRPHLRLVSPRPTLGGEFRAQVYIDASYPLGAYTIELTFNPALVQVQHIDPGTSDGFEGKIFADPGQFASGTVRFAAFQAQSLATPTGKIHIADVTLKSLKSSKVK